ELCGAEKRAAEILPPDDRVEGSEREGGEVDIEGDLSVVERDCAARGGAQAFRAGDGGLHIETLTAGIACGVDVQRALPGLTQGCGGDGLAAQGETRIGGIAGAADFGL